MFFGNKVRLNGKDAEKAVFEALITYIRAQIAYLKPLAENICLWRGRKSGDEAKAFFDAQFSSAASAAPAEEKK